jgi:hypothetical protein
MGSSFEVTAENVRFLSSRGETGGGDAYGDDEFQGGKPAAQEEDDIPF